MYYLYIAGYSPELSLKPHLTKIGFTYAPHIRVYTLRQAFRKFVHYRHLSKSFKIWWTYECQNEVEARVYENACLAAASQYLICGEWFSLSADDAVHLCRHTIDNFDLPAKVSAYKEKQNIAIFGKYYWTNPYFLVHQQRNQNATSRL